MYENLQKAVDEFNKDKNHELFQVKDDYFVIYKCSICKCNFFFYRDATRQVKLWEHYEHLKARIKLTCNELTIMDIIE